MEAALPNLLIRILAEPADTPFSRGVGESSHDHDPFGVSFRSKPAAGGGAGSGGGGSPLSVSPTALKLGMKERWDISPRSVVTPLKVCPPSKEGHGKAGGGGSPGEVDMPEQSRLLCLGIWDDAVTVEDLANTAAAAATDVIPGDKAVPEEEEEEEEEDEEEDDDEASAVAKGGSLQLQG